MCEINCEMKRQEGVTGGGKTESMFDFLKQAADFQ